MPHARSRPKRPAEATLSALNVGPRDCPRHRGPTVESSPVYRLLHPRCRRTSCFPTRGCQRKEEFHAEVSGAVGSGSASSSSGFGGVQQPPDSSLRLDVPMPNFCPSGTRRAAALPVWPVTAGAIATFAKLPQRPGRRRGYWRPPTSANATRRCGRGGRAPSKRSRGHGPLHRAAPGRPTTLATDGSQEPEGRIRCNRERDGASQQPRP
jgi:hypothetical protein